MITVIYFFDFLDVITLSKYYETHELFRHKVAPSHKRLKPLSSACQVYCWRFKK